MKTNRWMIASILFFICLFIFPLQSDFNSNSLFSFCRKMFNFVQFQGGQQILTADIHGVFRGLKFLSNAEIEQKGAFFYRNYLTSYQQKPFRQELYSELQWSSVVFVLFKDIEFEDKVPDDNAPVCQRIKNSHLNLAGINTPLKYYIPLAWLIFSGHSPRSPTTF